MVRGRWARPPFARKILDESGKRCLSLDGDDHRIQDIFSSKDIRRLDGLTTGYDIVLLDEAQKIPEVGVSLKLLYDSGFSGALFVTGSSSFDLASKTKEALTGRTWTFTLFPIAFAELAAFETPFQVEARLEETLVLGSYPALYSIPSRADRIEHLVELTDAYLYKDVLELGGIKNPRKLRICFGSSRIKWDRKCRTKSSADKSR